MKNDLLSGGGRIKNRFIARVLTRFPFLAQRLIASHAPGESRGIPWAPLTKPLRECTVALVTTAGVHHRDQPPFTLSDREGDPSFREIDLSRPLDSLMVTHDYYDHRDADRDLNVVFPAERMREFERRGIIGRLAGRAYGFMGHITGPHAATLVSVTAPEVAGRIRRDGVDAVLLTPG